MNIWEKLERKLYDPTVPYVGNEIEHMEQLNKGKYNFKLDLFVELGISDNPKRELFFKHVFGMGQAYCCSEEFKYADVLSYAEDLVELIR